MKKIIQRTRRFEKSFLKLPPKTRSLFIEKLSLFIDDEHHPSLRTHALKGQRRNEYAFSVTHDIRALYKKFVQKEKIILIFTFIDIGTHNKVY